MPSLGYRETQQLIIESTIFDGGGVATISITGQALGEEWALRAFSKSLPGQSGRQIGEIRTNNAPGRPDLAHEITFEWISSYCRRNDLEVRGYKSHASGPFEIRGDILLAPRAS